MLKKIGRFLKFAVVAALWSAFWICITRHFVFFVWKFDYASSKQWHLVRMFWNKNGTIKGASDYLLFLTLIVIVVFWFIGLRKLFNLNYIQLLFKPLAFIKNRQIEKYKNESKHVVIKNLVIGEKVTLEDLVNQKIKEEKNTTNIKESETLRQNIAQKIIEQKGK